VHVHDENVPPLRKDVDADDLAKPASPKQVQLDCVATAHAENRSTGGLLVRDIVDQLHRADARIVLTLGQGSPQLRREVVTVLRRPTPAEPAQKEPVRRFPEPVRTGSEASTDTEVREAHAAIVRCADQTGGSSTIAQVSQTKVELPSQEVVADPRDEAHLQPERRTVVIRPARRWPHLDVRELWHYRELMFRLVWRDVVVRYKQTFLGVTWALLVPALTTTVYVVVFGKFAKFPHGNTAYPALTAAGVIPMQYFASALTSSSTSLVSNLPLVTKVYFPRILLPLAAVIVPLFDLLAGFVVLLVVMGIYGTWPDSAAVALAPAFLALAVGTALGVGFLLSTFTARWRDVPYMIPVFLQILPLVSGVMYALDQIPTKWQWVFSLNPMSGVIAGWRWALLGEAIPNWGQMAVSVSVSVTIVLLGLAVFRSFEPRFADTI
jgi:lipopolysaccharide transport system permease protein